MILLNFSHPLTDSQRAQIVALTAAPIDRYCHAARLIIDIDLPAVLQQIRSRLRPNPPTPFPGWEGGGSEPPPLIGEGAGGEGR